MLLLGRWGGRQRQQRKQTPAGKRTTPSLLASYRLLLQIRDGCFGPTKSSP